MDATKKPKLRQNRKDYANQMFIILPTMSYQFLILHGVSLFLANMLSMR